MELQTQYNYITFLQNGSADRWVCRNVRNGSLLGTVVYHGAWWQYVFQPEPNCLFSAGCLIDIREFVSQLNVQRRMRHTEGNPQEQ